MSQTPSKSGVSTRRSSRRLDIDYRPSFTVHVVNSPVAARNVSTPQSPAFATRSRLTIKEKVDKLSGQLDGALRRSVKGSATLTPRTKRGPKAILNSDNDEDEEDDKFYSQQSELAELLPASQGEVKSPKPKQKLSTSSISKALVESDDDSRSSSEDKSDERSVKLQSKNNDEESEEDSTDSSKESKTKNSSDETEDYFSAEEADKSRKDKAQKIAGHEDSEEGSEDNSEAAYPVVDDECEKLSLNPRVVLEKIELPENSSTSTEDAQEPKTPQSKKTRRSAARSLSASQRDSLKDLVDSSLKVISMEINAVVSKKDETTGEKKLSNIKIVKGSSASPSLKKLTPLRGSPLQVQAKKQDIQKKAMKNWNVTDTEGSETTESEEKPRVKVASPKKRSPKNSPEKPERSPAKSPEKIERSPSKSTEKIERSPSKSPDKIERSPSKSTEKIERSPSKSPEKIKRSPIKAVENVERSPLKSPKEQATTKSPQKIHEPVLSPVKKVKLDLPEEEKEEAAASKETKMDSSDNEGENGDDIGEEEEEEKEIESEEEDLVEDETDFTFDTKEGNKTTEEHGMDFDEDSDEAPEEVSMQTSKKTVQDMMKMEVDAMQQISLEKREKQQKREERMKEEKKKKKSKSVESSGIEMLSENVIKQLENDESEAKEKKKRKRKRKNNKMLVEDYLGQPNVPKRKIFDEDFIPLKVDGPTKFGLVPLDGSMQCNNQGKDKWTLNNKTKKNKRMNLKLAKKAQAKQKSSLHGVPTAFKGDQHFF